MQQTADPGGGGGGVFHSVQYMVGVIVPGYYLVWGPTGATGNCYNGCRQGRQVKY